MISILLLFDANKLDISDEFKNAIEASAHTHSAIYTALVSRHHPSMFGVSYLFCSRVSYPLCTVCAVTTTRSVWC